MEELKTGVIAKIRSCLISTKGQITLRQLENDYRTLIGERIPYHKLGYSSLESFLRSVSSLTVQKSSSGEIYVDAKVSEKSVHIVQMVAKQKNSAPKRGAVKIPRLNKHRFQSSPPSATNKWRPKNSYTSQNKRLPQKITSSSRLTAISHNQFINSYPKPSVPSKIVIPDKRTTNSSTPSPTLRTTPSSSPSPLQVKEEKRVSLKDSDHENNEQSVEATTSGRSSPINSARRRISRVMSRISPDRDSGNGSPTTELVNDFKNLQTTEQEYIETGDPVISLKKFVEFHNLGELSITFTETRPKKSRSVHYYCKVKVNQHSYSSYPEDFFNKDAAEQHAAQKALKDLMTKYKRKKSLLISEDRDIVDRIPHMLKMHQTAIWKWQMEADYIDKFNEQLPSNWLQVIDSCRYVSIENCAGGTVLQYCQYPEDVLQKGKKLNVNLDALDVSVPCTQVQRSPNNRLYVMVTAALSVSEIWCQQYGTEEYQKFTEMTEAMEKYYEMNKTDLVAKHINENCCYVIKSDATWLRIRATNIKDGYVNCFFLDYGLECLVSRDEVYILKREFAVIHTQAFICRLDGLEELVKVSIESEHLTDLIGKEFILELSSDEPDEEFGVIYPVVMYDVTTGKSINEELITLLTFASAMPILNNDEVTEVYISNIEPNGDVYVQIHSPGYYTLQEMLEKLKKYIDENQPEHLLEPITRENSVGKLYLVQGKITGDWLRASIIDWSPYDELAQIYFVDIGSTTVVNVKKKIMYPLDKLDDVVCKYPPQALKVRIMVEQLPEDFVEKASKLMTHDQPIILKIIRYDNENVAWVEFFKRSNELGLFCINKSITFEAELQKIHLNNNNERSRHAELIKDLTQSNTKTIPSGGNLPKPDLPGKQQYFNVHVPSAVNPWNFFVQPLKSFDQLSAMMRDMQEAYKNAQLSPLLIDDIVPGKIYASQYQDGKWYRTSVLKVIHATSISVFYCDFGHYASLSVRQLVPLDARYMNFPYQALKAKLDGIVPMRTKWTVEDCDFFKKLVTGKQFVSVLIDIEQDELHKSDNVLKLVLIDTSGAEDVYIKHILIQNGIAADVS